MSENLLIFYQHWALENKVVKMCRYGSHAKICLHLNLSLSLSRTLLHTLPLCVFMWVCVYLHMFRSHMVQRIIVGCNATNTAHNHNRILFLPNEARTASCA